MDNNINVAGMSLIPAHFVLALTRSGIHWKMHSAQWAALSYNSMERFFNLVKDMGNFSSAEFPKMDQFALGIPITVDNNLPQNVVYLVDHRGEVIFKIEALSVPMGFYEDRSIL